MNDTTSIGEAIESLYEAVSGPAGAERSWGREQENHHPDSRLIRTGLDDGGRPFANVMSWDGYIENTREFFGTNAFYEKEVFRETLVFGNIAHAWSTYEARHDPGDAIPFKRGINSIQLFFDGDRWKIMTILWDNERGGNLLPERT